MDSDILTDLALVPSDKHYLLDRKQQNRDYIRAQINELDNLGHLIIHNHTDCEMISDCEITPQQIADRFGYAPQPGFKVYLGADFTISSGNSDPIYVCPWSFE